MYERLLIATDGSELSQKAATAGIDLAAGLGADIVAFTVAPSYPMFYFEGSVVLTPDETARIEQQWRDDAQHIVDLVQKQAHARNLKASAIVGHGKIAESIISAAKKHQCDLIVMASHGRKGLGRILIGSETLDVLTHSHIPVLVLR